MLSKENSLIQRSSDKTRPLHSCLSRAEETRAGRAPNKQDEKGNKSGNENEKGVRTGVRNKSGSEKREWE